MEYAKYMPFGLSVAASFLDHLHEPREHSIWKPTVEELVRNVFDRGGRAVDDELRALVIDIYNLYTKLNLTLENL